MWLTGEMMDKRPQVSANPRLSMPLQVEEFWNRMKHFSEFQRVLKQYPATQPARQGPLPSKC